MQAYIQAGKDMSGEIVIEDLDILYDYRITPGLIQDTHDFFDFSRVHFQLAISKIFGLENEYYMVTIGGDNVNVLCEPLSKCDSFTYVDDNRARTFAFGITLSVYFNINPSDAWTLLDRIVDRAHDCFSNCGVEDCRILGWFGNNIILGNKSNVVTYSFVTKRLEPIDSGCTTEFLTKWDKGDWND